MSDRLDIASLANAAGVPVPVAEHYAPLLALIDQLVEAKAERPRTGTTPSGASADASALAIEPTRLYTQTEAARLLGFGTPDNPRSATMTEIPETDLTRCRVGPSRGGVRYLGADLLAYARGLPMPELEPFLGSARDQLHARLSRPHSVRPISPTPGRRRVQ